MGMTQPNGNSGTYRVPATRVGELRMVDGAVFGNIVDRLGAYESLQMEPDQLKEIAKRYKEYEHLFKKA